MIDVSGDVIYKPPGLVHMADDAATQGALEGAWAHGLINPAEQTRGAGDALELAHEQFPDMGIPMSDSFEWMV